MSPAGHWPQLEAAVAAGADAVYFGLQHFSARAKVGFELNELGDVMRYLHRHAVKGFVTFNTLVFDHELEQAADAIAAISQAGCDAIIVQDVGVASMARQIAPDLDVHGSTQMSITSAQGAELAASLGCSRVVLGRELSLKDIRKIAQATDVELEVFVHGALCVSYSGQCFSSEAWGGRSANRGQCAQACRLSYDLVVDGQRQNLGLARYLLSPGDLYALEQIPELVDIGIDCFKIEGRYKGPEYVALTTRAYRDAIDACFDDAVESTISKTELEQVYSRGLGPHFISGVNHQNVVAGRSPRHRGLRVAKVVQIQPPTIVVRQDHEIFPGDGLMFDSADWRSPDEPEEGGNVFQVDQVEVGLIGLKFGFGKIDFDRIRPGDLVFRTNDPALNKKATSLTKQVAKTTGLEFKVFAMANRPLSIRAVSDRQETAEFIGNDNLEPARSNPLNEQTLIQQLARLGGTPFHLVSVDLETKDPVFCPVSSLNQARRAIVDRLIEHREQIAPASIKTNEPLVLSSEPARQAAIEPQIHLLVRNAKQLAAALRLAPASITLDYLELYGLRPSVEEIKSAGIQARIASPRILKPSEQNVVRFLLSLESPLLIRSGGLLHDLVENFEELPELYGDFSLNTANSKSFDTYLRMGLKRLTPSHDLNADQIKSLASANDASCVEAIVFQHLPVFHTEHCVFCRFLSDGTDNTNCGHPCEQHEISLQDAAGRRHPVMADVGCRNTVFGAEAQVADAQLASWQDAGIHHFRIEFVHETEQQVEQIADCFQHYFSNRGKRSDLKHRLEQIVPAGMTEGSLFVPKDYQQLVQLK